MDGFRSTDEWPVGKMKIGVIAVGECLYRYYRKSNRERFGESKEKE